MIGLHPVHLTFRSDAALTLPHPAGALWRGAIGQRLRADACITGAATCDGCPVVARCDYGRLFEPVPPREGLGRRFPDPPRPWVLAPGPEKRVKAGDTLTLDITVTAGGLHAWPALRRALGRLRLGPARPELVDVTSRAPAPENAPPTAELTAHRPEIPPVPSAVRVVLDSPLRLQHEGRPLKAAELNAGAFAGALLRRLDALGAAQEATLHAAEILEHVRSSVHITEANLRWRRGARISHSQARRVPLGGLTGEFTLTGDLEPLWPWLWTGQWIHVGKSAVMGLGRYRLIAL